MRTSCAVRNSHSVSLELLTPFSTLPRAIRTVPKPEIKTSPALSLTALPGERGIRTRKVAILVANGFELESVAALQAALVAQGAEPRVLAPRIGMIRPAKGAAIEAAGSLENSPSVLFDAVAILAEIVQLKAAKKSLVTEALALAWQNTAPAKVASQASNRRT